MLNIYKDKYIKYKKKYLTIKPQSGGNPLLTFKLNDNSQKQFPINNEERLTVLKNKLDEWIAYHSRGLNGAQNLKNMVDKAIQQQERVISVNLESLDFIKSMLEEEKEFVDIMSTIRSSDHLRSTIKTKYGAFIEAYKKVTSDNKMNDVSGNTDVLRWLDHYQRHLNLVAYYTSGAGSQIDLEQALEQNKNATQDDFGGLVYFVNNCGKLDNSNRFDGCNGGPISRGGHIYLPSPDDIINIYSDNQ